MSTIPTRPDFLIVGAGVIGCAIARELVRRRAGSVVVIDSGTPGAEASAAAAGVLAVNSSRSPRGALMRLKMRSAAMFPELVEALREETGIDVEYRTTGLLELAFDERDARELRAVVAKRHAAGEPAEWLASDRVREMEPSVAGDVAGGVFFGDDNAINNTRMVEALRVSAERGGARFLASLPLRRAERCGRRLVAAVAGDVRFEPGHLIVAAGLGSRAVGEIIDAKMPIRADRGEMVALRPQQPLLRTTVWRDGYLVPRNDGEVLIGATSGRGKTEKVVTPASLELLLRRAARMIPALAGAPLVRQWAGVRPMCTLRRPMIGPVRGYENVTVATGHHRSGILLAPVTAALIADSLLGAGSAELVAFKYKKKP